MQTSIPRRSPPESSRDTPHGGMRLPTLPTDWRLPTSLPIAKPFAVAAAVALLNQPLQAERAWALEPPDSYAPAVQMRTSNDQVASEHQKGVEAQKTTPSRRYINLTGFPFPLGPFTERRTVMTEVVPGKVYSFEQEQSLSGITANVRSLVFRMRNNHLLVYNPVAPTEEFLQQIDALQHDGVSHILLGATPYEHKIFVGPFARKFPQAKVWAVPDQWSFPLPLPAQAFGIDTRGSGGGELVDTAGGSAAYRLAPDLLDEFEVGILLTYLPCRLVVRPPARCS